MSKELSNLNYLNALRVLSNCPDGFSNIVWETYWDNLDQALTELETLQKKYKLADDVLADIGETLVDVSKWHITENKAIEEIRKYTSAYHNKN
jgi:hypothetical protein